MKKTIFMLAMALTLSTVTSCSKDEPTTPYNQNNQGGQATQQMQAKIQGKWMAVYDYRGSTAGGNWFCAKIYDEGECFYHFGFEGVPNRLLIYGTGTNYFYENDRYDYTLDGNNMTLTYNNKTRKVIKLTETELRIEYPNTILPRQIWLTKVVE